MKSYGCSLLAIIASMVTIPAQAQETSTAELLPEAVAEGERVDGAYEMGTGNDSGTSTINQQEIEARADGSGDASQLLKILPTVQFRRDEGVASPNNILDLRPESISISGGRIYNNMITIDGVDVGSRLDVTNDNVFNGNEPAGNAAQTIWFDTNLIGEITLRDSNISAEFGSFTGGALAIETRLPRRYLAANGYYHYSSEELTTFKISDATMEALDGDPVPPSPIFEKARFGGSIDLPVSADAAILLAASRQVAHSTNYRAETYGGGAYDENSEHTNVMLGGVLDLSDSLTLTGKATYSPYELSNSLSNAYNRTVITHGGGYTGNLELSKAGPVNWELRASLAHSDSSRDSSPIGYSIASESGAGDVCSLSSCTFGGVGDLNQTQDTYVLAFKAETDLGPGILRGGFDYERVEANRNRPEENFAYSRSVLPEDLPEPIDEGDYNDGYEVNGTILCDVADPMTCADGEFATAQYNFGQAYDVDVALDGFSAWAEYDVPLGPIDLRGGLRYDYESFLGNHDFSPRVSLTWNMPMDGWQLTAGANRYYGKSMLIYAIRQAYPNTFIYRRRGTVVGNDVLFTDDDWFLYSESIPANFAMAELDTPHSDELAAALTGQVLGGTMRLKGILRWGKDEFARSAGVIETGETASGSRIYRQHEVTNDGSSIYRGVSMEWVRTFGANHTLALNVNYSETETDNVDYLTTIDDLEAEDDRIYFQGDIVSLAEILDMNSRLDHASPFIANASWTALWFEGRLTTNLNFRYRNGFDRIEETNVYERIDGVRYEIYETKHYSDSFDLDVNAKLDLARTKYGTLALDLRLSNMLNRIPSKDYVSATHAYQFGRQAWIGVTYDF